MLFIYRFSEFNRAKKVASGSAEGKSSLDSFLTKPSVQIHSHYSILNTGSHHFMQSATVFDGQA